jgi:hypothetical protein
MIKFAFYSILKMLHFDTEHALFCLRQKCQTWNVYDDGTDCHEHSNAASYVSNRQEKQVRCRRCGNAGNQYPNEALRSMRDNQDDSSSLGRFKNTTNLEDEKKDTDQIHTRGYSISRGGSPMEQGYTQSSSYSRPTRNTSPHVDTVIAKRTANSEDDEEEGELDEFGRRRQRKHKQSSSTAAAPPSWPPCFDTHGSSYVLDARSSLFYEPLSDFFYNPQCRFYYGNRSRLYYRYNPDLAPPFEAVDAPLETDSVQHKTNLTTATSVTGANKKARISIQLTTTSFESKKKKLKKDEAHRSDTDPSTLATTLAAPSVRDKQHVADIEKWSVRQKELQQSVKNISPSSKSRDSTTNMNQIPTVPVASTIVIPPTASLMTTSNSSSTTAIHRTKQGEPICLLCRRKFPSVEKLRQHEEVSALHRENLEKKAQQEQKQALERADSQGSGSHADQQSAIYVDRAQLRRDLYGPDETPWIVTPSVQNTTGLSTGLLTDPVTTLSSDQPISNLGAISNIGKRLLEKQGWKEGASLLPSDQNNTAESRDQREALSKEWERIEALSAATARSNRRSTNVPSTDL